MKIFKQTGIRAVYFKSFVTKLAYSGPLFSSCYIIKRPGRMSDSYIRRPEYLTKIVMVLQILSKDNESLKSIAV